MEHLDLTQLATSAGAGWIVALATVKVALKSVESHIDTLKTSNADCERRYSEVRKELSELTLSLIKGNTAA